jgi:hypothetical protein
MESIGGFSSKQDTFELLIRDLKASYLKVVIRDFKTLIRNRAFRLIT